MKIQPLYDLRQEVNRLFIAGARFASGDPRLGRLAPVFDKLGEKAPVFSKVAASIREVVSPEPAGTDSRAAAEKLKALGVMLYSILYTQGETLEESADGLQEQRPLHDLETVNTGLSYGQLKVLRELSVAGTGRLELVQDALEQGVFRDFRTFRYLDAALGDKYTELADYVENTVIPQAGAGLAPFLLDSFAYEDRSGQIRRFRALARFNPPELKAIAGRIFEETLPGLQAVAVGILADDPENEDFIIKLGGDKNKKVREAAFEALGKLGTSRSLQALLAAFQKAKSDAALETVAPSLAAVSSRVSAGNAGENFRVFFEPVFERIRQSFAELLALGDKDKKSDPKEAAARAQRFTTHLGILKNKDLPEVTDFLAAVLSSKEFNAVMKANAKGLGNSADWGVHNAMAGVLDSFGPETALAFYERHLAANFREQPNPLWNAYFKQAAKNYPSGKLYETFAPVFGAKVISIERLFDVFNEYMEYDGAYYRRKSGGLAEHRQQRPSLDGRWLSLVYAHLGGKGIVKSGSLRALRILHAFEPRESSLFNKFLTEISPGDAHLSIALERLCMIMDRELPDRFEMLYEYISKYPNRDYHYHLSSRNIWSAFPAAYAGKFRKLHESCGRDYLLRIIDEIPQAEAPQDTMPAAGPDGE